jgi:hypothetical protein
VSQDLNRTRAGWAVEPPTERVNGHPLGGGGALVGHRALHLPREPHRPDMPRLLAGAAAVRYQHAAKDGDKAIAEALSKIALGADL